MVNLSNVRSLVWWSACNYFFVDWICNSALFWKTSDFYPYGIIRLKSELLMTMIIWSQVHKNSPKSDRQSRVFGIGVFNKLSVKSCSVKTWQSTKRNIWSCKMKWNKVSCTLWLKLSKVVNISPNPVYIIMLVFKSLIISEK